MLLEVGRIVRPHGRQGEVLVALSTNRTERLAPGAVLSCSSGERLEVERAAAHGGRWRVAFVGRSDRQSAERLRGLVLLAPPIEDPGALWVHELIGASVVDSAGTEVGTVSSVEANPASDLLVLDTGGLVPARFVVAHEPGRLVVDLPPGLLDGSEEAR